MSVATDGFSAIIKALPIRSADIYTHSATQATISPGLRLGLSLISTGFVETGRGLAALRDAVTPSKRAATPPGLGVRPILCRSTFLPPPAPGRLNHTLSPELVALTPLLYYPSHGTCPRRPDLCGGPSGAGWQRHLARTPAPRFHPFAGTLPCPDGPA